jgi:hypothetical protein
MNISQFPLAWRWTNEQHTVLPVDILAQMIPQTPEQAKTLFDESLMLTGNNGLDPSIFSLAQITTADITGPSLITSWLFEYHPEAQTPVYLSWQADTALLTNWGVFASYWDDFCYPVSDDLVVLPEDRRWALLYHHSEFMQYGIRR